MRSEVRLIARMVMKMYRRRGRCAPISLLMTRSMSFKSISSRKFFITSRKVTNKLFKPIMNFIHVLYQLMIIRRRKPLIALVAFEVLREEKLLNSQEAQQINLLYLILIMSCDSVSLKNLLCCKSFTAYITYPIVLLVI